MIRFKMLARDVNSNPTQYRTWIVNNTPDYTGQYYTGPKSGPAPFVDVSAYIITDDNVVADFDLPLPTDWFPHPSETVTSFPIRKVLPAPLEDSSLAVIDGYIYMFGGKITSHIYRASVANPADWIDTGAVLPSPLYGSSLAIVDGYIYLFGGNNGYGAATGGGQINNIYVAPVSNPLDWTDTGSTLPRNIQYSNLFMYGGNIYLFGGLEINGASDVILTASISSPNVWTDTGEVLPKPIYGSILAQIDGYIWNFGGLTVPSETQSSGLQPIITNPTMIVEMQPLIWQAPVTNPTAWTVSIDRNNSIQYILPYKTAFGQFITIGNSGYIIGPMESISDIENSFEHIEYPVLANTGFTPIIRCNLSNPNSFSDTGAIIPAVLSHTQIAIIYDRIWFFGGSGLSAIYACNQNYKYSVNDAAAIAYANVSRVVLQSYTFNLENPFQVLCYPYWLTDYQL